MVEKSGSWFSYGDQRIGQGRENAKNFLRENTDLSRSIEARSGGGRRPVRGRIADRREMPDQVDGGADAKD